MSSAAISAINGADSTTSIAASSSSRRTASTSDTAEYVKHSLRKAIGQFVASLFVMYTIELKMHRDDEVNDDALVDGSASGSCLSGFRSWFKIGATTEVRVAGARKCRQSDTGDQASSVTVDEKAETAQLKFHVTDIHCEKTKRDAEAKFGESFGAKGKNNANNCHKDKLTFIVTLRQKKDTDSSVARAARSFNNLLEEKLLVEILVDVIKSQETLDRHVELMKAEGTLPGEHNPFWKAVDFKKKVENEIQELACAHEHSKQILHQVREDVSQKLLQLYSHDARIFFLELLTKEHQKEILAITSGMKSLGTRVGSLEEAVARCLTLFGGLSFGIVILGATEGLILRFVLIMDERVKLLEIHMNGHIAELSDHSDPRTAGKTAVELTAWDIITTCRVVVLIFLVPATTYVVILFRDWYCRRGVHSLHRSAGCIWSRLKWTPRPHKNEKCDDSHPHQDAESRPRENENPQDADDGSKKNPKKDSGSEKSSQGSTCGRSHQARADPTGPYTGDMNNYTNAAAKVVETASCSSASPNHPSFTAASPADASESDKPKARESGTISTRASTSSIG